MDRDRPGFWLPLLAVGTMLLASIPLFQPEATWPPSHGGLRGTGLGGSALLAPGSATIAVRQSHDWVFMATSPSWYWPVGLITCLLLTIAWYGWRAHRTGTPKRPLTLVFAAAAGVVAILTGMFLLGAADSLASPTANEPDFVRNFATATLLLGLGAVLWNRHRQAADGAPRRVLPVVGWSVAILGATLLFAWFAPGSGNALIIVVGLLVLASFERSFLLAGVSLGFLGAVWLLGAPAWDGASDHHGEFRRSVTAKFSVSTTFSDARPTWSPQWEVIIPAAVLLLGAIVPLLRARTGARPNPG